MIWHRVRGVPVAIALCSLATCREALKPDVGPPGLAIVSGAGIADTVGARLAAPLVVELRDSSGLAVPDTFVEFSGCCGVMLSADTFAFDYNAGAILRTDAAGRAYAYVQLGTKPESAYVTVHAARDSIRAGYLVRVGNLARIVIGIRDSAAYVSGGYDIRAYASDRFANYRPDPLSYAASSSVLSVDSTGRLTAKAIGRGAVVVRAGPIVDSAWATVPPHGLLTAFDVGRGAGASVGIVTFQLDGSGYKVLDTMGQEPYYGAWPSWTPNGSVLFTAGSYNSERLYLVDTLGGQPSRALPISPVSPELFGSVSRNGAWFYFSSGNDLWRAQPGGSAAANLGVDSLFGNSHSRPSASADGARVVVLSAPVFVSTTDVTVVDATNATVTRLGVGGNPALPRWSPGDSLILFWNNSALWVTSAAGLGTRQVTPPGVQYPIGEDWSPDGQWLITRRPNVLELLNLATGERLPLPYGTRFVEPSWRP